MKRKSSGKLWAKIFEPKLESAISGAHKIWVTRSQPGAQRSVNTLTAMGYDALALPLLTIGPPPSPPPALPVDAVLILTSQNGLWALITETDKRDFPVICVGDVTAGLASDLGFTQVVSACGNSQDILKLITQNHPNDPRIFVHISGSEVRGDITETLRARGYCAERHIYYRSSPVSPLEGLYAPDIGTVLLYSPKGAAALRLLALDTSHMTAISISAETDAELGHMDFKQRLIAPAPNEAAMFTMLD